MVALKSFRTSSAGGVDGLRIGHLKDLVAPQTAEAGRRLLKALANLSSNLLRSQFLKHARDLFAANLTPLRKRMTAFDQSPSATSFVDWPQG